MSRDAALPSQYLPQPEEPAVAVFPEIVDACSLLQRDLPEPAVLVQGLLHQGSKLVLGGSSKAHKTWCLIDLALSVAFGEPWLACKTTKGRVLYVNLEIQDGFFRRRLQAVAEAKNVKLVSGHLDIWNLRGHAAPHGELFPRIRVRAQREGYALIILDPIYKTYGNLRENDAGDIAELLNSVDGLASGTGAAVGFGAHFSKGNQAGKESLDRICGSGVFARDPDSILVMTAHEQERCFTVEATLRNFKPLEPFVIRWDYPIMRRDESLDPGRLKQAQGGRKTLYTAEKVLAVLGDDALTTAEWRKRAEEKTGMSRSKFFSLRAELEAALRVIQVEGKWRLSPNESPESPKTG